MDEDHGGRIADDTGHVIERVRQVITRFGRSHREFARRIVMAPSKPSRPLGGTRRFPLAEIVQPADIGGVDTGWLLDAPERPAAPPERGPADIAACGTSPAAVHYHFPGRDELLEADVRWCTDEDTERRGGGPGPVVKPPPFARRAGRAPDGRREFDDRSWPPPPTPAPNSCI